MKFTRIIVTLICVFLSITLLAQVGPQPGNPPQPVPISGFEWLLLSGGILGARKIYQNFKARKEA